MNTGGGSDLKREKRAIASDYALEKKRFASSSLSLRAFERSLREWS
jgi:hypothetical protein